MLAITDFMLPLIHRKMCNVPVNRNYGARSEQRLLFHHTATMMPREGEKERERTVKRTSFRSQLYWRSLERLSRMETRRDIDRKWGRAEWQLMVVGVLLFSFPRIEYYLSELLELYLTESVVASVNEYHERERKINYRSTDTRNL